MSALAATTTSPAGRTCRQQQHARVPRSLLADPRFRKLSKLATDVLLVLLAYRNGDGVAWPSVRRISADLGVRSPGRVSQAVRILVDAGLITTDNCPRGKPTRRGHVYRFDSSTYAERSSAPESRNGLGASAPEIDHRALRKSAPARSGQPEPISRENKPKEHTTTRSSRDGGSRGAAAAQGSKKQTEDINREAHRELIKARIGEPKLSQLSRHPRITAGIVRQAVMGDEGAEIEPGTGLIILNVERRLKADEIKHEEAEACRKAERTTKALRLRRKRRYKRIINQADDAQRIVIRKRWEYPGAVAADDPIPGDRLFILDPEQALYKIIDAVHGAPPRKSDDGPQPK